MAFILNGITLPTPKGFSRSPVSIEKDVTTMSGMTKRDFVRQKYKYEINYTMLTQAEVATLMNLYTTKSTLPFSVTETNLSIAQIDVLMNITNRKYNTPGGEYREDFNIILIEV